MKRGTKSAANLIVFENSDPISRETEAIRNRIRERAFQISQTRPLDAHEIYDWIVAESEIISVPPAELIERDGMFEAQFAVAGINAGDVQVMVTPDQILLKSDFSHQHESDIGTVHLCDFKPAVFRCVNLPEAIDVNSVKVRTANGLILVSARRQGAAARRPKRAAARKAAPKKSRARVA
jgi:HSP20 family molecular chaperone IbpA